MSHHPIVHAKNYTVITEKLSRSRITKTKIIENKQQLLPRSILGRQIFPIPRARNNIRQSQILATRTVNQRHSPKKLRKSVSRT